MSLISCPECSKEISSKTKKCVHCGYAIKSKKKGTIVALVIVLLLMIILGGVYFFISTNNEQKAANIALQEEIEKKEEAISSPSEELKIAVNGLSAIRKKMKNPDSMQLNSVKQATSSLFPDGYIMIYYDITAENGFGGSDRKLFWVTNFESDANTYVYWDYEYKVSVAIDVKDNNIYKTTSLDKKLVEQIMNYNEEKN